MAARFLLAAVLFLAGHSLALAGQTVRQGPFAVAKVVDGDTIELDGGRRVRLLGVDAPELHHPELPVQRFAREAADFLEKTIAERPVTLEVMKGNEKDVYGRLLAYVYAGETFLNGALLANGYAYAYLRQEHPRQAEFIALENEARGKQRGLWNFSLRDGRIASILDRYGKLNPEGRRRFDAALDGIAAHYPAESSPLPSLATAVIPWQKAGEHEGETVTVEGTIGASYNSGKACFLNFDRDHRNTLTLVIFASRFDAFPPRPESFYKGKKIRASGRVKRHGGRPQIILESPAQITPLE